MSDFMKIHSVGTELYHADGQTYRQTAITKLIVAFRNFANAPKPEEALSSDLTSLVRAYCGWRKTFSPCSLKPTGKRTTYNMTY